MVDYRNFRLSKIITPEYSHLKLLLYWPCFGLVFLLLERGINIEYHPVSCEWDKYIPFCEFFIIPYYYWFIFLIGMHIYTLFFDVDAFKKMMYFIMITYTVTSIIYIFYPTMQQLRPPVFERDNICTRIVAFLYVFDTNTNVCPSLHVIGSFATLFTAWNSKRYSTPLWRLVYTVLAVFISVSTVFLKQHSIIDVLVALPICFIAYPFAYILPGHLSKARKSGVEIGGQAAK